MPQPRHLKSLISEKSCCTSAETGDAPEDYSGVYLRQRLVVGAKPELHVGAVVLDYDIGLPDQLIEDLFRLASLEIQCE